MSKFNKNPQVQMDEEPFRTETKFVEGKRAGKKAGDSKMLDHSKGPDTHKKFKAKGFKDIQSV